MLKKSRKLVGKPTGRVTKAGRPVLKTPEGEERSEYSTTIKLDNGKYINIPSIHNGKYYTEDELKKAVEDKRMIPTSEHDSFEEAIEAAKKRSKTLKQGGVLKAHQGTIVNGQIVYPTTSQAPSNPDPLIGTTMPKKQLDMIADNFGTDPTTIPPKQVPKIEADVFDVVKPAKDPAEDYAKEPFKPLIDPAVVSNPVQIGKTKEQLEAEGKLSQPIQQIPTYLESPVDPKVALGGGQLPLFPTQMPMPNKTAMPMPDAEAKNEKAQQTLLDFLKKSQSARNNYMQEFDQMYRTSDEFKKLQEAQEAARAEFYATDAYKTFDQKMKEQQAIYDKAQKDAMKQFNMQFHGGNLFPGMGSIIGKQMLFNEGGTVMDKQMDFFKDGGMPEEQQLNFFDEGGMKDDGGEKDPVSGNDVPSGSLAKEVRDDVPAMVSEGEFIFPADVTRFIGLNKLMELRQDAKMGLKKMEAMGQLGNPDDAELPDDIPFDAADVIIMGMDDEEVEEKNEGGIVGFQTGTADPAQTYSPITQLANQEYANRYSYFENDAGDKITILTNWRGEPLQAVPAGYKIMLNQDGSPVTEKPKSEEDDIEKTQPVKTQPMQQDDNDPKDPMKMVEDGRKSAEVTAKRLGMDVDKYLALPIKTRFNLIGEELKVMRGAEPDLEKIEGIVNGTIKSGSGDGIFGFSLLGGIIDTIGSMLDRDGNGSMWSSTVLNPDGTGKEIDIFGNPIRTFTEEEMKAFGQLVDGRWQGNLENPYSPKKKKKKNNMSSNNTSQDNTQPAPLARPKTFTKDDLSSSSFNPVSRAIAGARSKGYDGVGKGSYNPVTRSIAQKREDNEARRQERENKANEARGMRAGPQTGKKTVAGSANKNTQKQKDKDKENLSKAYGGGGDGNMASGKFGNKGMLIAKPPTKKKPTKGKTLVKKRS